MPTPNAPDVRAALDAAARVADAHGLAIKEATVLAEGFNLVAELVPGSLETAVIARVPMLTTVLRPNIGRWIRRQIDVTRFLNVRGARVTVPSTDPPAGPHEHSGLVVSFWNPVEHTRGVRPAFSTAARLLAALHADLRGYAAALPYMNAPLNDIDRYLSRSGALSTLAPDELGDLRPLFEQAASGVLAANKTQPLHGDAHAGNLLATSGGWVWNDFEESMSGPPEWDYACLRGSPVAQHRMPRSFPDQPAQSGLDEGVLGSCLRLRSLHRIVWLDLLSYWRPEYRDRLAAEIAALRSGRV